MALLEIDNLTIRFGTVTAVHRLSFSVEEGESILLLGPNGAGKSSVLLAVMGLVRPADGDIRLRVRSLLGDPPWRRRALGVAILAENRRLFDDLTVEENLRVVTECVSERHTGSITATFDLFPDLARRRRQVARTLSGGERQLLAWARLLIQKPTLALLDDPLAGLDEQHRGRIKDLAKDLPMSRLIAAPDVVEDFGVSPNKVLALEMPSRSEVVVG